MRAIEIGGEFVRTRRSSSARSLFSNMCSSFSREKYQTLDKNGMTYIFPQSVEVVVRRKSADRRPMTNFLCSPRGRLIEQPLAFPASAVGHTNGQRGRTHERTARPNTRTDSGHGELRSDKFLYSRASPRHTKFFSLENACLSVFGLLTQENEGLLARTPRAPG